MFGVAAQADAMPAETATPLSASPSDARPAQVLLPRMVLRSSARHHPQILAALARVQAADAQQQIASGAFDTQLTGNNRARLSGTWDGRYADWQARRRLRPFGSEVYSKYRLSGGSFPIYEDESFTNEAGELKVGVLVSLLRDRSIDAQRFAETDAALAQRQVELDALLVRINVQRRALSAYWRWVTNGRKLEVYTNLLRIARERETGLETKVRQGARAAIELVENRQNIIRREELVTTSQRDFNQSALDLGLFYRDASGTPNPPNALKLPSEQATGGIFDKRPNNTVYDLPSVSARPERKALQTAIARINKDIELRRNNLRPSLQLGVELGRDLGSVAEGGPTRNGTDTIVSLSFKVPLQRRAARGKLSQSQAKRDELNAQLQLLTEQLEMQMRALILELEATSSLVALVTQEVAQAQELRRAEEQRFNNGASDFFLLNLREQAEADANVRFHNARRDSAIAHITYDAAVINLGRLELSETGTAGATLSR